MHDVGTNCSVVNSVMKCRGMLHCWRVVIADAVVLLTAVPVPEQPVKAKVSKVRQNVRKNVPASSGSEGAPPVKQRRLGWKPVTGTSAKPLTGVPSASCSSQLDTAAEGPAASQAPSSSQVNSSFTDRLTRILISVLSCS